jgi:hypothetical protein
MSRNWNSITGHWERPEEPDSAGDERKADAGMMFTAAKDEK